MKIGILSMQEIKNYGSFLQAYSLKKNIEALGHQCDFVNIIPGKQLPGYEQTTFNKGKLLIKRLWGIDVIKRFSTIYKFQKRFTKEFLPYLGVRQGVTEGHFDVVVIGSDEVFNCAQKTWFGFSPQLYSANIDADKVITYAASFGATTIEKLEKLNLKDEIASLIKNIKTLSVRDENSRTVVQSLIGITPSLHVDPVLIYDYTSQVPTLKHQSDYIIVYSYPGRISDNNEIDYIKKFAKDKGLRLLSIGHYFPWCDDVVVPSPFEVLAYFRDAAYIITDTFHGSVFSIKYNKQFCTIVREMNKQKLTYLLCQFGLENRIVTDMSEMSNIMEQPINYNPVNELIDKEKKRSLDYLSQNLASE